MNTSNAQYEESSCSASYLTWLVSAALSPAMAYLSAILRALAIPDITYNGSRITIKFANLMRNASVRLIVVALPSASLAIFGVVLASHPRLLREIGVVQYKLGKSVPKWCNKDTRDTLSGFTAKTLAQIIYTLS